MVHSGVLYKFLADGGTPKRRGARGSYPLSHPLDRPDLPATGQWWSAISRFIELLRFLFDVNDAGERGNATDVDCMGKGEFWWLPPRPKATRATLSE